MKKIIILVLLSAVLIYCGGNPTGSGHNEAAHNNELDNITKPDAKSQEDHDALHITSEKQKNWGLTFHAARLEKVSKRFTLPGVLKLNQNKTAQISSFAEGKIEFLSVDLGSKVGRGQKLATINSPEFAQAQADFLKARASRDLSLREFERAQHLLKEKALEEKEFLRRKAEKEKLVTEYRALGSKLLSFGLRENQLEQLIEKGSRANKKEWIGGRADSNLDLLSPLPGTIISRKAIVGEHVEPTKVLFIVSNLATLWAQIDAYEEDLMQITRNSSVFIHADLYPEKVFTGKITYISDMIDDKLRTAKIRVEVNNSEGLLKPNMYIQGIFKSTEEKQNQIVVPEASVQNLNGEKILFVRHKKNEFILRHVTLGEKSETGRIILSGLKAGEVVVVSGAFSLKSEMGKDTRGHDHAH
jgi:membrane fusion protein, heavy metal efflux system